jgi:peptide/nickel transport system substrate-binding protein
MKKRVLWLIAVLTLLLAVAGCGGGDDGGSAQGTNGSETEAAEGEPRQGGILRQGTTDGFDSINPFVAFSAQSYATFLDIYPILVQYDENFEWEGDWAESWETSPDGLTWTFHLKPGGEWSDGTPLTAEDAVWTGETIIKYKKGPTANLAPFLSHVESLEAPDENTLVITYARPVGNVLPQLQQFFILPKHVWEKFAVGDGKELKQYLPENDLPLVSGGQYILTEYDKKGTTILERNPGFYGTPSNPDALGIQWFANSDAMLTAFQSGELDSISVPLTAVSALEGNPDFEIMEAEGFQINNFIFNSNPDKPQNRELLDPEVREAFSHAMNREEMIEVVYGGHADPVASIVIPAAGEWVNPNLEPEAYDLDLANQILDDLGYERGSDGIRVVPATTGEFAQPEHRMSYEIITPDSLDGINRAFEIVKTGLAEIGVEVTQNSLDSTTAFEEIGAPDWKYENFDLSMWDWVGYLDPDFVLSVLTCDQWGGWSDTAYCNPEYDKLYEQQGGTADQEKRKEIVWEMQDILYRDKPYIQLVVLDTITAHSTRWAGFLPGSLDAYTKAYNGSPYQVE